MIEVQVKAVADMLQRIDFMLLSRDKKTLCWDRLRLENTIREALLRANKQNQDSQ